MSTQITKPALLDATGQEINANLSAIADALNEMASGKLTTWAQIQAAVRQNRITRYLSAGDQMEVGGSVMVTAYTSGSGVTAASVDKDTFIRAASSSPGVHEFIYDGAAWHYGTNAVSLASYGVTVTGTPAADDAIVVTVTATEYDYNVMGIDEEVSVNADLSHVLSIQMDKVLSRINFDPPQYLYAVTAEAWPDGMPAGTYNITLDRGCYDGGTSEDGSYSFTTTKTIPVGGGIRHTSIGAYLQSGYSVSHVTGGTFITYNSDTFTALESGIATVVGANGTNLGTATAHDPSYKSGDYINFTQRNAYGSNRWSTSYIRQLLNSDDAVLDWKPGTIWSRNLNITPEGFLHTLDTELRAVLCKVRKRYALSIADGYGYEDVEDIVTLATMLDVFGSKNNSIAEGPVDASGDVKRITAYSFWRERSTDADRIKKLAETAVYWWFSSVNPSHASSVRSVNASGALNYYDAYLSFGVVPSLHIG